MSAGRKIYTKTGDRGETSLLGGSRVPKHHDRIEAYGTLDELNSFIGYLRDQVQEDHFRVVLKEIQDRIFTAESLLAADPGLELSKQLPRLIESDIHYLETEMDSMSEGLPELKSFILPGGAAVVSLSHICRTVCRRAERQVNRLAMEEEVDNLVRVYLNRLSDYFFILARKLSSDSGIEEPVWKPRL